MALKSIFRLTMLCYDFMSNNCRVPYAFCPNICKCICCYSNVFFSHFQWVQIIKYSSHILLVYYLHYDIDIPMIQILLHCDIKFIFSIFLRWLASTKHVFEFKMYIYGIATFYNVNSSRFSIQMARCGLMVIKKYICILMAHCCWCSLQVRMPKMEWNRRDDFIQSVHLTGWLQTVRYVNLQQKNGWTDKMMLLNR